MSFDTLLAGTPGQQFAQTTNKRGGNPAGLVREAYEARN